MSSAAVATAVGVVAARRRGTSLLGTVRAFAGRISSVAVRATFVNSRANADGIGGVCFNGRTSTCIRPLRSPDLVETEYAELGLTEIVSEVGHVRIRQHVNPLSSSFMTPAEVPNWEHVFVDPSLPLMVDIGSGSGRLLIWLAKNSPGTRNYLGLEIRHKLVKRAESWVKGLKLRNIHFIFANAAVSFERLVSTYPGPLVLVSILCPDPHFKKKHHKRRVLQKPLIDAIIQHLTPGGWVFVQSDILDVAHGMRSQFDAFADVFQHIDVIDSEMQCDLQGWLLQNPFGKRTEREIHAELEGAKIYRRFYFKRL